MRNKLSSKKTWYHTCVLCVK